MCTHMHLYHIYTYTLNVISTRMHGFQVDPRVPRGAEGSVFCSELFRILSGFSLSNTVLLLNAGLKGEPSTHGSVTLLLKDLRNY